MTTIKAGSMAAKSLLPAVIMTCGLMACSSEAAQDGDVSTLPEARSSTDPLQRREGLVVVGNYNTPNDVHHMAVGNFMVGRTDPPEQDCQNSTIDACEVSICRHGSGAWPSSNVRSVSAGTMEISGARIASAIRLQPNDRGIYTGLSAPGSIWSGGEEIFVSATGASSGVPAFSTRLKAPSLIHVAKPWDGGGELSFDRTRDIDMTWTHEAAPWGKVNAALTVHDDNGMYYVNCSYPVDQREGKIPSAALAQLPAGNGGLSMRLREESILDVSGWEVTVALVTEGARSSGLAAGPVTLK